MTGGAAALCLILDAGFLGFGPQEVNPEAIAVLGTAVRLEAELASSPLGQRIDILLEDDGSGAIAVARQIAGQDLSAVTDAGAVGICDAEATGVVIALTPRQAGGRQVWLLGDALYGLADVSDADRRLREVLGVPVPRPMAPDLITGELLRLAPGIDETTLLRAVFDSPRTSWAVIAGQQVLYSEDSDQIDALLAGPGAVRLSHAVHLTRLRLVQEPTAEATVLLALEGLTLIEAEGAGAPGISWRDLRFGTLR